jgi:Protein tyrosine and serine/threonine kinase/Leucine Rich repeats (2 copies)
MLLGTASVRVSHYTDRCKTLWVADHMSLEILSQLQSGQLKGCSKVSIAAGLTTFPMEILDLADSLEVLDLSNNRLKDLPDDFDRLKKLKILFISQNEFEQFPAVLGRCEQLSMVGFKANRIREVPEHSLPPLLRWLILTDNAIEALPTTIGHCARLQKLMLAGNQLRSLPEEMKNCRNLELVRLAANPLDLLPDWLLGLPRLSWLGIGQNLGIEREDEALTIVPWDELVLGDRLGEGASGVISQAVWRRSGETVDVAVKIFKGAVTSDGLPDHEMQACVAAGSHPNLVGVLGQIVDHPEGRSGLVLPLLETGFEVLGNPPSFESCTRDTFADDRQFDLAFILRVAQGIAAAAAHLHDRGIMHGDLYAHNILVNAAGDAVLSDFGAASFYQVGSAIEGLEVRAFGCLLEDLLDRCSTDDAPEFIQNLRALQQRCLQPTTSSRPRFHEICDRLHRSW